MLNESLLLWLLLLSRHLPTPARWVGGVRRTGIGGRDNNICKGLGAGESLVHLAEFGSSISLAHGLGSGSDAEWRWRGRGRGWIWRLQDNELPPLADSSAESARLSDAGLRRGAAGQ